MPRAGVQAMIDKSLVNTAEQLGNDMAELNDKVDKLADKVLLVVGDPTIPNSGLLPTLLDRIEAHANRQGEWREDDVKWREKKDAEAADIRKLALQAAADAESAKRHVEQLKERMQLLAWLMMGVKAIKSTVGVAVDTADKGKKVYAAFAAITSGLTLMWVTWHNIIPWLQYCIHHKTLAH